MPAPHVAAYLRISRSDDRSTSIDKQRSNVRHAASTRYPGRPIVEYVDDGISASKGRTRAGLDAMLAAVAAGSVLAVLVDTQDRLTRDRGGLVLWTVAEACEKAGAELGGASEDIDVLSASGEFTVSLRASVARYEARRTGERVRATNKHRASLGLGKTGGVVVWGMRREGDTVVADPERAPLLLEQIHRVIAGEQSIRGMAEEFTARGVPTSRGNAMWSHRAASKLLHNPSLAGMVVSGGDVLRGADGLPVVHPGALIDVPTYAALQRALEARTGDRRPVGPSSSPTLLYGLVVDSQGHRMHRHTIASRGWVRYECSLVGCPARTSIDLPTVDEHVVSAFRVEVGELPQLRRVIRRSGADAARLAHIRAEIARTAGELAGARDVATIQELAARLGQQRQAEEAEEALTSPVAFTVFEKTGLTNAEALDAASTPEARRAVLAEHVSRVVIVPGSQGGRNRDPVRRIGIQWVHDEVSEN